jgi:hypothetical protein
VYLRDDGIYTTGSKQGKPAGHTLDEAVVAVMRASGVEPGDAVLPRVTGDAATGGRDRATALAIDVSRGSTDL